MKNASAMTKDELQAQVEKIQASQAKRYAYSKRYRKTHPPSAKQKANRLAYGKRRRANEKAIVARAKQLGILGAKVDKTPRLKTPVVPPVPPVVSSAPPAE
jgi:hypothetical protein